MKKTGLILFALVVFLAGTSANGQVRDKWKEVTAFHEVMSTTYHPAEEGKLDPIRTRSAEMVEKAVAWQQSTPPKGYNKDAVKDKLDDLVNGSKEIDKLVKEKASDEVLKAKLSALHDIFHEVIEKM